MLLKLSLNFSSLTKILKDFWNFILKICFFYINIEFEQNCFDYKSHDLVHFVSFNKIVFISYLKHNCNSILVIIYVKFFFIAPSDYSQL